MATIAEEHVATVPDRRQAPYQEWDVGRLVRLIALLIGAVIFIFPFYYMVIVAFKTHPEIGLTAAIPTGLSLQNYATINGAINLGRTLVNSGIFTGGVLLLTLVFGLLAGYALAQLHWRGRNVVFYTMLLFLIVPFQLLMIPLYVLIARDFGLADNYLGMILPFAINSTAVFIFRQFFLQLPRELFEAARLDGASELQSLILIVIPITRPAILTALLVTFIGPWNEFLWPFLITKQLGLEPLAVALANFMSNIMSHEPNPPGALLAGAVVLVLPVVILFLIFQRQFVESSIGSSIKG
ncbi:MAG: carbohydrate ABC transporter permease [Candidatus Dormibacteraeota bacterium]|nr:carbohydrate ABC transporter permease [Candidatus Dormibacteraeota bacterium]